MKRIIMKRSVLESILSYARACHPREGILLLRGKTKRDVIEVNEVLLPPLSVKGKFFSAFPLYMLPIDFSIVGTAHSHPSGALSPSIRDLNSFYGKIMIITAYPYRSENDIIIIDGEGKTLNYEIV